MSDKDENLATATGSIVGRRSLGNMQYPDASGNAARPSGKRRDFKDVGAAVMAGRRSGGPPPDMQSVVYNAMTDQDQRRGEEDSFRRYTS